ncbi:NMDA receptor-regulated protein 1-domain-containing protein [Auriculariales sp. MPI-PUGE-AT-0066]|nr:NMDA receptor-regulated protein 1-domain-containing protein [Auriculariales sp. MPI-PUGE-AT-0066]
MLEASIKSRSIVDRLALLELRPRLLAKLGRTDEAEAAYRAIIERNPDNAAYIEQLAKLKSLAPADSLELLADLEIKVPKGSAPTRIALDVATSSTYVCASTSRPGSHAACRAFSPTPSHCTAIQLNAPQSSAPHSHSTTPSHPRWAASHRRTPGHSTFSRTALV